MNGFLGNLAAEAIGLVVGLFVTYLIVKKLLRWQEERTWRPAKKRLLRRLRSAIQLTVAAWVNVAKPAAVPRGYELKNLSPEEEERILSAAAEEMEALKNRESEEVFKLREPAYWRKVVYALSRMRSPLTDHATRGPCPRSGVD